MIIVSWMYTELRVRIGSRDLYSTLSLYLTVQYFITYSTLHTETATQGPRLHVSATSGAAQSYSYMVSNGSMVQAPLRRSTEKRGVELHWQR